MDRSTRIETLLNQIEESQSTIERESQKISVLVSKLAALSTENVSAKLRSAAQKGDLPFVVSLLSDPIIPKSLLNEADEKGYTALHHASYFDEHEIVRRLLEDKRIEWNAKTDTGLSCLHLTAMNNCIRTLKIILDSGIEREELLSLENMWNETPLHLAAASGHAKIVEVLLLYFLIFRNYRTRDGNIT
eukprot:TRINITY_DN4366_c0_g1_i1.p1 TRINITY_DN4366_c0_g1~~TRINITY_DN4366_c0_g1_i1.p1  ORF type:complete len:200 (+),score=34.68 TRINITY_DN4366_c0_g1_i1:34-600(+)